MSFYLQVGDVLLADGSSDASGYSLTGHPSFPEPAPDGFGGHEPAVRSFSVRCTGSTASAAAYRATVLRRECVRDKRLYFRHGASGDVLECRIREGRCTEAEYTPAAREGFGVQLDVSLETDPYWLGAWSDETSASASVTTYIDSFDIADPGGEVDALLSVRCVPTTSGTILAIGVKPGPGAEYDFHDANGSAVTASAAYSPIGSADQIDTNDNWGRHRLFARLQSSGSGLASIRYKGRTTTVANALASSVSVDEYPITPSTASSTVYELGDVVIPAGRVPSIITGTGYATEEVDASFTSASGVYAITDAGTGQTFDVAGRCKHTGVTLYAINNASAEGILYIDLWKANASGYYDSSGYLAYSTVSVSASYSGEVRASWETDPVLEAGTYGFYVSTYWRRSDDIDVLYSTASAYASGHLITTVNEISSSADLYFKSWVQLPLGFDSSNPILVSGSGGDYITLGSTFRIPVDYACVIYRDSLQVMGLYYDADTDTPYDADADGIGAALYDKCEVRAPLRAKPGETNRVVVLIGQGIEDGTNYGVSALTYKTRPRYLTATG